MEELRRRVALHGPPQFECPGDFTAVPFAPGPPFSPEMLQDPTKQLLLIRAPADFTPESLNDQVVPLSGLQTLKVLQSDRTPKVYSIQTTPGESGSCAHLLIPSDRQGQTTCAPPFAGSLTIWERFGDPTAHQILLPVAHRLVPQIPDGLRQRFLPFGGQQKRPLPSPSSLGDAEMPPQKKKKKKKRRLHTMGYLGDPEEQQSPEVSLEMGGTSPQLKEEVQEEEQAVAEGGRGPRLSGAAKELPEWETQAIHSLEASSQESFFSAEAEELNHRTQKRRRKKKHTEAVAENKDSLLDLSSVSQQAEEESQGQPELQLEGNGETGLEGLVQHKHKKKKKHREEAEEKGEAMTQTDLTSLKEEAGGDPWEGSGLGNIVEGSLGLTEGGPGGELPDHKSKRKKKKKKKEKVGVVEEEEEGQPLGQEAGSLWSEPIGVKQEQKGWVEVDAASGQGAEGNGSLELGLEVPAHKHKKKKKKKEQESKDP